MIWENASGCIAQSMLSNIYDCIFLLSSESFMATGFLSSHLLTVSKFVCSEGEVWGKDIDGFLRLCLSYLSAIS